MLRRVACILALLTGTAIAQQPTEIKIGHLHASSGAFANFSMPVYDGLKLWVDQANSQGGVFVKAYNKKLPLRLISYDDQSNTTTAATLANQLITQDKVDILVSDAGSVLTSVVQPIAREHKMLLFDVNGAGATLFGGGNPYIILTSAPSTAIWPKSLADFLADPVVAAGYHRLALIYGTNDANAPHVAALKRLIKESKAPIDVVFEVGVPTSTSNYTVILDRMAASNPDIVVEIGYPNNDIAFFQNLQDSGRKYPLVFAMYPGLETGLLMRTVGIDGLRYAATYVTAASIAYKPTTGMTLPEFRAAWTHAYHEQPAFGWNAVQGYTAGLVVEQALAHAQTLDQLTLRQTLVDQSNQFQTLDGRFALAADGEQTGELLAIGQLVPDQESLKLNVVYPPAAADAKPVFNH